MSKSGSAPSGTTTTNVQPWTGQQPYLTQGFQAAQNLYNGTPPQYFSGMTYAPENTAQSDAINSLGYWSTHDTSPGMAIGADNWVEGGNALSANPANSTFGTLTGTNLGTANSGTGLLNWQAYNNPTSASPFDAVLSNNYLSGKSLAQGNPNTSDVMASLKAQVEPGIESQFINGGSLSSPEAARATAAGVASAAAPYLWGQYNTEEKNQIDAANSLSNRFLTGTGLQQAAAQDLGNQAISGGNLQSTAATGQSGAYESAINDILRGVALAPATEQMLYTPGETALGTGTTQQNLDQASINDQVQRWNYNQTLPWTSLNEFLSEIGGTGYGSSTTTPFFNNSSQNLLGGAAAGASLGNLLFPAAAGGTAYGAMGGAGIGALFGMLSDRRAKTDIEKVGELDNGLPVYSYRYHGEPEAMRHIGLMADEVAEEHPDAVHTLPPVFGSLAGLQTVDYARAVQ